jgi:hypothetical protein
MLALNIYDYIILMTHLDIVPSFCIMKICFFSGKTPKNEDNNLSHTICDIFSDCLSHDAVYVNLSQKHLMQFITRKIKLKTNQMISITSLADLLLSIKIEKFHQYVSP